MKHKAINELLFLRIEQSENADMFISLEEFEADFFTVNPFILLENRDAIKHVLVTTLTKNELKVIELRFGLIGKIQTYQQIAEMFNVSRERVRQVEAKALRKLRHPKASRSIRWLRLS